MVCQKCGTENSAAAHFCVKCGSPLSAQQNDNAQQNQQNNQTPQNQSHLENVEQQPQAIITPSPNQYNQAQGEAPQPSQGYRPPSQANQPQEGYQQTGYQQPSGDFRPHASKPPPGYQQPPGNQPPPPSYQQPHGNYNQQGYPPPQQNYQQRVQKSFLGEAYSTAFRFLFKKPIRLWGLSLLASLLTVLSIVLGVLPIIWIPIIFVLQLGIANIYLCGYRGKDITATQLFEGFNKNFLNNAGAMGWRYLWLLIWFLIPFAGIVIVFIKYESYRFVPYIMLNNPGISGTEALKKSKAMTHGYKGKMFLADLLIGVAVGILTIIFVFVARIPFIGPFLTLLYGLVVAAFLPLLVGILDAIYYDRISKENPVD